MTIIKTEQGIRMSDIVAGNYVSKFYIGYTIREAKANFKQYAKERENNALS